MNLNLHNLSRLPLAALPNSKIIIIIIFSRSTCHIFCSSSCLAPLVTSFAHHHVLLHLSPPFYLRLAPLFTLHLGCSCHVQQIYSQQCACTRCPTLHYCAALTRVECACFAFSKHHTVKSLPQTVHIEHSSQNFQGDNRS